MDNDNTSTIGFFTVIIILNIVIWNWNTKDYLKEINQKIDNIQPTINEQICEELLPYRFRGRQYFVCYNEGQNHYNQQELIIIEQWKNTNQK